MAATMVGFSWTQLEPRLRNEIELAGTSWTGQGQEGPENLTRPNSAINQGPFGSALPQIEAAKPLPACRPGC
jgi:hypothetical protein